MIGSFARSFERRRPIPPTFANGERLGSYEILEPIGAGGMGEVYKAKDLKLGRTVAIKVLQKELASDPDRLKRFEQEARSASALEHPNIVTIYDIAEADGIRFIVMQYVQGKTLRELLKDGRLKLSTVLDCSIQIAEGLAKAHSRDIVHRDLKPDNIMVSEDGLVKIVDFGLAKLVEPSDPTEASTRDMEAPRTQEGHILGTAPYMSPEQAEGKKLDARSDIFSFGSVLYEMLTGQRAFSGTSTPALLAAILHEEPKKASSVPPDLERIVQRALKKEPGRRYQSMADVKVELQEIQEGLDKGRSVPGARRWRWAATGLALGAALAVAAAIYFLLSERDLPLPITIPLTSYPGEESHPAMSPDGNQVAFVRESESGTRDLYVKMIGGGEPLLISQGNGHAYAPAWSPDGLQIAFYRQMEGDEGVAGIFQVSALGGAERRLTTSRAVSIDQLSWSPDGKLLAIADRESPDAPNAIYLLSVDTADRRKLTDPPSDLLIGDVDPRFSPDGETVAFFRAPTVGRADLYLVPIRGGEPERLTVGNHNAGGMDFTPDGRSIVFSSSRLPRGGMWGLWKVPVSGGEPEPLGVDEQGVAPSLSRDGSRLTFSTQEERVDIWRVGAPGDGSNSPTRLIASTRADKLPRYSPDGEKILFSSNRSGFEEMWLSDADGSNQRPLTFLEDPVAKRGSWSPDSKQIAFRSRKEGNFDVYVVGVVDGVSRRLTMESWDEVPTSWSRDGRYIYFHSARSGRREVWKVPAEGGEQVQVTFNGGVNAYESFDGRILYFSKRSGMDGPSGIWRIPAGGGEEEKVTEYGGFNDWIVLDEDIYYLSPGADSGPAIERFELETGVVSQVLALGTAEIFGFDVSPDGRWVLYAPFEMESDIMLVENFR